MKEIFDIDEAMTYFGNDRELLSEIISAFLEIYHEQLDDVVTAVAGGSPDKIRETAHKLKGSIGSFGKNRAFDTALALEMCGRNKQTEKAGELLLQLTKELVLLEQEILKYK